MITLCIIYLTLLLRTYYFFTLPYNIKYSPIKAHISKGNVQQEDAHNKQIRPIVNNVVYQCRAKLGAKREIPGFCVRLHQRQYQPAKRVTE